MPASTFCSAETIKDVDAGTKPGHDEKKRVLRRDPGRFYDARQLLVIDLSSGWRVRRAHWFPGMSEMESRR